MYDHTQHVVLANPYLHVNNYGEAKPSATNEKLPDIPSDLFGLSASEMTQYKAMVEEFAPTVGKLLAGMTPVEQYAQLEARIKVMKKSPWLRVPLIGGFLQGRLAEYRARLVALEEEVSDYRELKKQKKLIWTLGTVGVGIFVLLGVTGVIRNIVQTTK